MRAGNIDFLAKKRNPEYGPWILEGCHVTFPIYLYLSPYLLANTLLNWGHYSSLLLWCSRVVVMSEVPLSPDRNKASGERKQFWNNEPDKGNFAHLRLSQPLVRWSVFRFTDPPCTSTPAAVPEESLVKAVEHLCEFLSPCRDGGCECDLPGFDLWNRRVFARI